jgi:hypothetical protein
MSPYIRTVKTSSGATAVQIVYSYRRGSREIEDLGVRREVAHVERARGLEGRSMMIGGVAPG